jgi:esterase/lipase superfamily enzyme
MKRPPSGLCVARRVSLIALSLVAGQVLTACAGRPGPETLSSVTLTDFQPKQVETLYSVTTRDRSEPGKNVFGVEKTLQPNYARFDISIPPNHKPANIEWPKRKTVDPRTDFAVLSQTVLGRADLLQAVRAANAAPPVVFVHGYNYNF